MSEDRRALFSYLFLKPEIGELASNEKARGLSENVDNINNNINY